MGNFDQQSRFIEYHHELFLKIISFNCNIRKAFIGRNYNVKTLDFNGSKPSFDLYFLASALVKKDLWKMEKNVIESKLEL